MSDCNPCSCNHCPTALTREAENSPATARQTALSLVDLARLFAEQWELGYQCRQAEVQARQAAGRLPEPTGAG